MTNRPNIILIIPDDMGWGQASFRGHPHLNTPHLDNMAANGAVMTRFYSNGPQCSPTRASVLTGRAGDRGGVHFHGYRLNLQERTIAQALRNAGYRTAHFGKWHVNGLRGQFGAPMLTTDTHNATAFGFNEWTSNINNIAYQGLVGDHNGNIWEIPGDSSDAIAEFACDFIDDAHDDERPFFAAVCFSAPHAPFFAQASDKVGFESLPEPLQNHLGMIVALDRGVGAIRQKLRDLEIEDNTLVWFFGDNGGIDDTDPDANGPFRDGKDSMYEGGLRLLSIAEWPGTIPVGECGQLSYTADVARTLGALGDIDSGELTCPQDGRDISTALKGSLLIDNRALPFHSLDKAALIADRWKIVTDNIRGDVSWELYNLANDEAEANNLAADNPDIVRSMAKQYIEWYTTVRTSVNGYDYFEQEVVGDYPYSEFWVNDPLYADYVGGWSSRPEYAHTYWEAGQPPKPYFDEKYNF